MQITRRDALMGATAAAVVAGVPGAAMGEDAALLAQVARFYCLYEASQSVWAKQQAHRARIEAMPDCPSRGGYKRRDFLETHDAFRYCDESERLGNSAGALANAIFETPPP